MKYFLWTACVFFATAQTEIELNIQQNVDNCFTETFTVSESNWNSINAQDSFVNALKDCLKVKNMLQISDDVLQNVSLVAGNLTLQASAVSQSIQRYEQFSQTFHTQLIDKFNNIVDYILSIQPQFNNPFKQSSSGNNQQKTENVITYLDNYEKLCKSAILNNRVLIDKMKTFIDSNVPLYATYLEDYVTQQDQFRQVLQQKTRIQNLILQDALTHARARIQRQVFQAACTEGQTWLTCTNDFQHASECYRPARIYHQGQLIAVNSSIEIAEPSFCKSNQYCVYTPTGFQCSTTGNIIPSVVHHKTAGFGRSYDVLHRYGMFDISFFTKRKLQIQNIEKMQVETLGDIDLYQFEQYIFGLYDQSE